MHYNIEWINTTEPTVRYDYTELDHPIDQLTERFEQEFKVSRGDDIGGLIVYSESCVYDYENFVGWVK